MRFPSKYRISENWVFNEFLIAGKILNSPNYRLYWKTNNFDFPRLAIRVPKKELRGAVLRNRLKRVIREIFRNRLDTLLVFDYVIVCKRQLGVCSNKEIRTSFVAQLNKISPILTD